MVLYSEYLSMSELDSNMTPEERWTQIENTLKTIAEYQARHDEWLSRHDEWLSQHDEWLSQHEEWFARIEGSLDSITEHQVRYQEEMGHLSLKMQTLVSTTGDLAGVSRHLVTVQGELVESNSLLRRLVESHANRLDGIQGQGPN